MRAGGTRAGRGGGGGSARAVGAGARCGPLGCAPPGRPCGQRVVAAAAGGAAVGRLVGWGGGPAGDRGAVAALPVDVGLDLLCPSVGGPPLLRMAPCPSAARAWVDAPRIKPIFLLRAVTFSGLGAAVCGREHADPPDGAPAACFVRLGARAGVPCQANLVPMEDACAEGGRRAATSVSAVLPVPRCGGSNPGTRRRHGRHSESQPVYLLGTCTRSVDAPSDGKPHASDHPPPPSVPPMSPPRAACTPRPSAAGWGSPAPPHTAPCH